jgi:hypothetical protein
MTVVERRLVDAEGLRAGLEGDRAGSRRAQARQFQRSGIERRAALGNVKEVIVPPDGCTDMKMMLTGVAESRCKPAGERYRDCMTLI